MRNKNTPDRPAIWSEGSQKPPFEARAFLRGSLFFARKDLAHWLDRGGVAVAGLGGQLGLGRWRIPAHRLGRIGRFLPRVESCGAALQGLSRIMQGSAALVAPDEGSDTVEALPFRFHTPATASDATSSPTATSRAAEIPPIAPDATTGPVTPTRPLRGPVMADRNAATGPTAAKGGKAAAMDGSQPDALAAIRTMMRESDADIRPGPAKARGAADTANALHGATGDPQPGVPVNAADVAWRQKLIAGANRLAVLGLGHGLTVLMLPWGAVRAGYAHVSGEDLRQI